MTACQRPVNREGFAINESEGDDYLQLKAKAARHARTWWQDDPGVAERCRQTPGLQAELELASAAGLVTTGDVYEETDGAWAAVRRPVQYGASPGSPPFVDRGEVPRQAFLLAGAPGAGKTTVGGRMVEDYRMRGGSDGFPLGVVSADHIRERLPEYANGLGSQVVQYEACFLAYEVVYPLLLESMADVVVDSIGRVEFLRDWADALAGAGCQVHLIGVYCRPEIALERMRARARGTHRLVPSETILETAEAARSAITSAQSDRWPLTSWVLIDNSRSQDALSILEECTYEGGMSWQAATL